MENYISINIIYLVDKSRLGQDDFGQVFDLGKGLITKYVNKISLPKIETIQKICSHFNITLDEFINTDLSASKPYGIKQGTLLYHDQESNQPYVISPRYVTTLEKTISDKEKIITLLEERVAKKEIPSTTNTEDGLRIIDEIENLIKKNSTSIV